MISSSGVSLHTSAPLYPRPDGSRSKVNQEFLGHFCAAHPPNVCRTRNDEEFYGGFRRSTSLRRSHRSGVPESGSPHQQQMGSRFVCFDKQYFFVNLARASHHDED